MSITCLQLEIDTDETLNQHFTFDHAEHVVCLLCGLRIFVWALVNRMHDAVVVIKIGALFVVVVLPTLSYEIRTPHVFALFTFHQTLFSRVLGDYCMSCVPWKGPLSNFPSG